MPWYERLTASPELAKLGYVDANRWQECLDLARLGRTTGLICVLATITLEMWLQQLTHFLTHRTLPHRATLCLRCENGAPENHGM